MVADSAPRLSAHWVLVFLGLLCFGCGATSASLSQIVVGERVWCTHDESGTVECAHIREPRPWLVDRDVDAIGAASGLLCTMGKVVAAQREVRCWAIEGVPSRLVDVARFIVPGETAGLAVGPHVVCAFGSPSATCVVFELGSGIRLPLFVGRLGALSFGSRHSCWSRMGPVALECDGIEGEPVAPVTCSGEIASGDGFSCCERAGDLVCWGLRPQWRFSHPLAARIVSIDAGDQHLCFVDADARVFCLGYCAHGRCGLSDGGWLSVPTPLRVSGALDVAADGATTCVLFRSGSVSCWGPP